MVPQRAEIIATSLVPMAVFKAFSASLVVRSINCISSVHLQLRNTRTEAHPCFSPVSQKSVVPPSDFPQLSNLSPRYARYVI